jgi:hypothetical protein
MRRLLALVLVVATACSGSDEPGRPAATTAPPLPPPTIPADAELAVSLAVRSTRPDLVTGGDALIEVAVAGAPADVVQVDLDGRDVTDQLPVVGAGRRGVVSGLPEGSSELVARRGEEVLATLTLVNHPTSGPLFSGPQPELLACSTVQLGLGPPLDEDCSAPTRTSWWYLGGDGIWHQLADGAEPPADAERGPDGDPVVVRRELGTLNRAVYEIAVPDDGERDTAVFGSATWNGDLVHRFGGGCGTGRIQGGMGAEVLDADLLTRGYMVATSTFATFDTACDDVLSAETLVMLREHVAERYGIPRFVIGQGDSGGAIQQYLIAQNYPGLLDAAHAQLSFPDIVTTFLGTGDCGLLERVWAASDVVFTEDQRAAVEGYASVRTCAAWNRSYLDRFDPTTGCASSIRAELVYDPDRRPDGVRCTPADAAPVRYGVDPMTGAAIGPWGNAGVQYGLEALRTGVIDAEQFVTVNELVGGYDRDGRWQPARTVAPPEVVERMYAEGRVLHGGGGLAEIPVIDVTPYTDELPDIHDRVRLFAIRDRMAAAGAPAGTRVIWTAPPDAVLGWLRGEGFRGFPSEGETVDLLVEWLEAAAADTSGDDRATVLARTRPAAVADDCLVGDEHLRGDAVYAEANACTEAYPVHGDPRMAAGGPRTADVVACRLAPIDPEAYGVPLTVGQLERLRAVFPDGVCDWAVPGIGQVPPAGTWRSYGSD